MKEQKLHLDHLDSGLKQPTWIFWGGFFKPT